MSWPLRFTTRSKQPADANNKLERTLWSTRSVLKYAHAPPTDSAFTSAMPDQARPHVYRHEPFSSLA